MIVTIKYNRLIFKIYTPDIFQLSLHFKFVLKLIILLFHINHGNKQLQKLWASSSILERS